MITIVGRLIIKGKKVISQK